MIVYFHHAIAILCAVVAGMFFEATPGDEWPIHGLALGLIGLAWWLA